MHTLFEGISFTENIYCHIFLFALSIGQKVIKAKVQRHQKQMTVQKSAYHQTLFPNSENCTFENLTFDRTVHEMSLLKPSSSE
jgi:hypothetical protein